MSGKRLISLAQLRKYHGKTQAQVAGEIGISKATFSAWETGRIEIGAHHLIAISKVLNCTPNDILDYHGTERTDRQTFNSEEQELVALYRSLPPNIRTDIMDIMRTTVKGWRLH